MDDTGPVDDAGTPAAPEEAQDDDESILKLAHARLKLGLEAEIDIRRDALDDLEFLSGKQWFDRIRSERETDSRPCLVINRLPQFVHQITNDQRQNQPAIKTHPLDDAAAKETSEIFQGLIRHIEYNSNADVAYDTGFEAAVRCGFGYWRILTEFADPLSFKQEIRIKRLRNQFSACLDPFAQEPDGSDAQWGFVWDDLSAEEFRAQYPNSKLASSDAPGFADLGNRLPGWFPEGAVRIAEYFYINPVKTTIHLLNTGETVREEDLPGRLEAAAKAELPLQVVKSRETRVPVVRWVKLTGFEILEKTDWPGIYIPIVPVYGEELYIDGKRILSGIVRNAKDPQRMYNYWKSAETEAIALAPKSPYIGAEGQFEDHEDVWETANRKNHAYLPYKPTTVAGQAVPPPQRQSVEPAVQAITQAAVAAGQDLKETTGIYDAARGSEGTEISGRAIQARNTQIQTANFHFVDNIKRSIKHTGRILIDLIPKVYDTEQAIRIIHEDGSHEIVRVNGPTERNGKKVQFDLSRGKYDCTVDVGPSYATRRQEAAASMMDFSRAVPQVAASCADLIVKNLDWPGATVMAERLQKLLPPGLADAPDGKQPIPPAAQAQMQQMGQLIDQLTAHLKEKTQIIEKDLVRAQMLDKELASKERIELAKIQADLEIQGAKIGSTEDIALLKHQIAVLIEQQRLAGMGQPMDADASDELSGAGGDAASGASSPTGGASPGSPMEGNP